MSVRCAEVGIRGDDIRSDCWIAIKITNTKGIKFDLHSKVNVLYGEENKIVINEMLNFFDIENAEVKLEDGGALPFVIMARMETVVRRLGLDKGKRYLPGWKYQPPRSKADRFRRSRLYLPGNQPKFFINAPLHNPDGIILDLEDSVALDEKDAARVLVRNALRSIDFCGSERMVRINQFPMGKKDLEEVVPQKVDLILIPKVETPDQIKEVDRVVNRIISPTDEISDVFFMPIIESALGIINAYPIASASKRNVALAIGLEDYTADIGTQRTDGGQESFFARSMIINAAKAAGIQAIDTVFSDIDDMAGLKTSVLESKMLGFDGKGCIHPRQISVINKNFAPDEKEIAKAKKIVLAYEKAKERGLGVVSLGSKMIDPPVVKRALRTIKIAISEGSILKNWRKKND